MTISAPDVSNAIYWKSKISCKSPTSYDLRISNISMSENEMKVTNKIKKMTFPERMSEAYRVVQLFTLGLGENLKQGVFAS